MINTNNLCDIDFFMLDMDGTIFLGDDLLPGAQRFLETLEKQGKRFIFLTNNSSRSREDYVIKLNQMGLDIDVSKIFTSGLAAALHIKQKNEHAKVYLAGTPSLEAAFKGHGFKLTDESPDFVVLGFDTTITYQKLWKLCDLVREGIPYIATHPDINCPIPGGFMPDIGAMIAFIKASTGIIPDAITGKPNRVLVDIVADKYDTSLERIAMVGDRLYTDVAMGETAGITSILMLSGETQYSDLKDSPYQPDYVFKNLDTFSAWLLDHCG